MDFLQNLDFRKNTFIIIISNFGKHFISEKCDLPYFLIFIKITDFRWHIFTIKYDVAKSPDILVQSKFTCFRQNSVGKLAFL